MAIFKGNEASTNRDIAPDNNSIASPFTPINPNSRSVPPNTSEANDYKPEPIGDTEGTGDDVRGIVPVLQGAKYMFGCYELPTLPGEGVVVVGVVGDRPNIPEGSEFKVLAGDNKPTSNIKFTEAPFVNAALPPMSFSFVASFPITDITALVSPYPALNYKSHRYTVFASTLGLNGENEYVYGQSILNVLADKQTGLLYTDFNVSDTAIFVDKLGVLTPDRGIAHVQRMKRYPFVGAAFLGVDILSEAYSAKKEFSFYAIFDLVGVANYVINPVDEDGQPQHECYSHLSPGDEDKPMELTATLRKVFVETPVTHIYINAIGSIEYVGSIIGLTATNVSYDSENIDLWHSSSDYQRIETNYKNSDYPANTPFTNFFNLKSVNPINLEQLLGITQTQSLAIVNDDSSISNYYGVKELADLVGYGNLQILGGASI